MPSRWTRRPTSGRSADFSWNSIGVSVRRSTMSHAPPSVACRLAAVLPAAPSLLAARSPRPPLRSKACAAPEHRQFDFWIGEWEVSHSDGALPATTASSRSSAAACSRRSWTRRQGWLAAPATMPTTGRGARGTRPGWTTAAWCSGSMAPSPTAGWCSAGETRDTSGAPVLNRITWQETGPGRSGSSGRRPEDGGGTWTRGLRWTYRKRRRRLGRCASGRGTSPFREPPPFPRGRPVSPSFRPPPHRPGWTATSSTEEIGRGGGRRSTWPRS